MIGSEASTRGCFSLIELQGCIGTGVCNGMSCGVRDGLPSHTKNNTLVGCLHVQTHRASSVCTDFSNPSNLIRVVCEVVRMLQAGACDERPRTS